MSIEVFYDMGVRSRPCRRHFATLWAFGPHSYNAERSKGATHSLRAPKALRSTVMSSNGSFNLLRSPISVRHPPPGVFRGVRQWSAAAVPFSPFAQKLTRVVRTVLVEKTSSLQQKQQREMCMHMGIAQKYEYIFRHGLFAYVRCLVSDSFLTSLD